QGDSKMCNENELLGTFVFSGIRPERKGKVRIEVTLHIDSEGILNLTARDKTTGQTVEGTLKLGKGGEERPKERQDPPTPPPLPLTMPTSMLAAQFGGMEEQEERPTVAENDTPPPFAPPRPSQQQGRQSTQELQSSRTLPEAPLPPTTVAPRVQQRTVEPLKIEPPPPTPAPAPTAAEPSLWGRVSGWFKSLFGG
ncbi:MAG TPA: Hsp70 family protein, partial [Myxococcota bacterium]|nr:Hsp70 family protein [Myxococcota bacterium]